MNTFDKGENSIKLVMWYRDLPLTVEELKKHDGMITKECRKYLIGKTCEAETKNRGAEERVIDIYARYGPEFGYTAASVKNLITYARAVDHFYKVAPDIAVDVLAGRTRLAYKNVIAIAKMELPDARAVMERLSCEQISAKEIFREQKERPKIKRRGRPKRKLPALPRMSVKDTPPYDPDSQFTALTYTIPSWVGAIDRAFMNADFQNISPSAQNKLIKELVRIKDIADTVISMLNEKK